jgi:hypothetical protein
MSRHGFLGAWIVVSVALLATQLLADDDTVTLKSGEVINGRVLSETDSNVNVEVSNPRHTIFMTRIIAKADIKKIHSLTPAQHQENEMFDALGQYHLNLNQEFTPEQYTTVIAACDKFLATYPHSEHLATVTDQRAAWAFEKSEVEYGHVKFGGTWMTPDQKKPLVEEAQRYQLEQALQKQVQVVRAARARVDAAHKEHDFLHSDAGYKGKLLPQPEYDQVMARYHANDDELAQAPPALDAAMAKFNELTEAYRNLGGTVNFQQQLDAK